MFKSATKICYRKRQLMCFSLWGTSSPRLPTGAPPLDTAGGLLSPRGTSVPQTSSLVQFYNVI